MSAFILFWHTAAMATFEPKSNLRVFRSENCFYKVDGEGREKAEKWSPREKRAALAAEILYFFTLSALANRWWAAGFAATQHLF